MDRKKKEKSPSAEQSRAEYERSVSVVRESERENEREECVGKGGGRKKTNNRSDGERFVTQFILISNYRVYW